jgi:SAM-dependent methyltransferase
MNLEEYALMFQVEDRHWWYHGLRGMLELYWKKYAEEQSAERRQAAVLDVGCGTGATLDWLAKRGRPTGIDFSPEAIRFCRNRGHDSTAVGSATALPCATGSFDQASFDAIISFDVFCHRSIPDKRQPLREIHRLLKPGGLLFLNLPAYQWLYSSHDIAVHTDHRFTRNEVIDMLQECGFQPLETTYWNTLLFPIILAVRLWRKILPPKESDLAGGGKGPTNTVFTHLLKCERRLIQLHRMPCGLSIFAVARKL